MEELSKLEARWWINKMNIISANMDSKEMLGEMASIVSLEAHTVNSQNG